MLLERQGPSLGLWHAAEIAVLREASIKSPVLDLGCGDGLITSMVLSSVEVGLDPDNKALEQAFRRGVYGRLAALYIEEAPLPEESFSTVVSNSVLEHIPQIDAALGAAARLLRPGGRLVFTVPTEEFSACLVLPLARYAAWRNRILEHLNLWPVERWAKHLQRAGLAVELVRPYLRPYLVRAWDALELLQQVRIHRQRPFSTAWRHLPPAAQGSIARLGARLDLSAPGSGSGRMIVARKR